MNIDERLEALTQSVELLALMHKDNEKRMEQFDKGIDQLSQRNQRLDELATKMSQRNQRLEELVTQIAEGTARLLRTVELHDERINDLEENRPL